MRRYLILFYLALTTQLSFAQTPIRGRVIAGSDHDFLLAQYYRIQGTNREIGKALAQIAKSLNVGIKAAPDPIRNKLQYQYFKLNYPQHYQRMLGVADEYRVNIDDYAISASSLPFLPGQPTCSVAFYPANRTATQHNILSRNLDMPVEVNAGRPHSCSRPVLFEIYPDSGYPSLYLCLTDLLGGAVEGINSEGLSLAVLGDEVNNTDCHPVESSFEVGLNEVQIMRYLLDNCKNVEEAKGSLLWLKQYYQLFRLHYLVADNTGKSFVFEFSRHRNQSHIVEADGIQCVTNHLLSNPDLADAPPESIERLDILKSLTLSKNVFTLDEIREIHSKVTPWMPDYHPIWPTSRTLWHSIYDLDSKSMKVKFYLGEMKDPNDPNKVVTKYSDYVEFKLKS
ncbi:MAG TPA: C45 family peptidase [Terriglobia bacterium]|nr:C45 family peptidase [Terriglobia bacterium]